MTLNRINNVKCLLVEMRKFYLWQCKKKVVTPEIKDQMGKIKGNAAVS